MFCNFLCCTRYHAREQIKKGYSWQKKNPEKYKEWRRRYYQRTKEKRICNTQTYQMLIFYPNLLVKVCKNCGSEKNLEIHHEEYDRTREGIRRLIKEGKIYFLCRECHKKTFSNRIKYPEKLENHYNPRYFI